MLKSIFFVFFVDHVFQCVSVYLQWSLDLELRFHCISWALSQTSILTWHIKYVFVILISCKTYHLGESHFLNIGRHNFTWSTETSDTPETFMKLMNRLTAVLVGNTQSNMSQPSAEHTTRSSANLKSSNGSSISDSSRSEYCRELAGFHSVYKN